MVRALRRWSMAALFHFRSQVLGREVVKHHIRSPYHAVSVRSGRFGACDLARQCAQRRFLSSEAPPLPLPGCNQARCDCRYVHHEDRRAGPRRATEQGMGRRFFPGRDRRSRQGRRLEDADL
ncbi:MAG: hypothetical protein QM718_13725 [Steroidobacteraceae bacterium]